MLLSAPLPPRHPRPLPCHPRHPRILIALHLQRQYRSPPRTHRKFTSPVRLHTFWGADRHPPAREPPRYLRRADLVLPRTMAVQRPMAPPPHLPRRINRITPCRKAIAARHSARTMPRILPLRLTLLPPWARQLSSILSILQLIAMAGDTQPPVPPVSISPRRSLKRS